LQVVGGRQRGGGAGRGGAGRGGAWRGPPRRGMAVGKLVGSGRGRPGGGLELQVKGSNGQGADDAKAGSPRRPRSRARRVNVAVNLQNCKYEVVRAVQKRLGWREVGDDQEWQLAWIDTSVALERVMKLKPTQKINHFTGMLEICRKKALAKNIGAMTKAFPDQYNFVPRSWILPEQKADFLSQFGGKRSKTFILKPDSGCQGKGIHMVQSASGASKALAALEHLGVVAQRYVAKPYLINGLKFDMRIYVLVLSCDPLRVFLYDQGLVRFCTEKYEEPTDSNLNTTYMHLTNYSLNKHNSNFSAGAEEDGGDGSKWSLEALRAHMTGEGHDYSALWGSIGDMAVKTLLSIQPTLAHNYRSVLPPENDGFSCFEVLGLDVMLDHKLKPWLIEVNHSPSFTTDSDLDLQIKGSLVTDVLHLVKISPALIKKAKAEEKKKLEARLYSNKKVNHSQYSAEELAAMREKTLRMREKYEERHSGGFSRIYPARNAARQAKYLELLDYCQSQFQNSFASKTTAHLEKLRENNQRRVAEERAREQAEAEKKERMYAAAQKTKKANPGAQTPTRRDPASRGRTVSPSVLQIPRPRQSGTSVEAQESVGQHARMLSVKSLGGHSTPAFSQIRPMNLELTVPKSQPLREIEQQQMIRRKVVPSGIQSTIAKFLREANAPGGGRGAESGGRGSWKRGAVAGGGAGGGKSGVDGSNFSFYH